MMDVKIAFFDIDGTLLKFGCPEPTEKTKLALKKLQEKGILVFAASGRPNFAIPDFGFDGTIGFNGGLVLLRDGTELVNKPLDSVQLETFVKKYKRPVLLAGKTDMGANGKCPILDEYLTIARQHYDVDPEYESRLHAPVYQAMAGIGPEEADRLLSDCPDLQATAWVDYAVDIVGAQTNKGKALVDTCAALGIPVSASIAFGDAKNDLELLQAAGTSVAMGNAQQEVKEISDFVAPSVEDDGVYHQLKALGVI